MAGCAGSARRSGSPARLAKAALIAPLSGPAADLGRSMERAARLAQPPNDEDGLIVLDSTGGAAAAAAQAASRGAAVVLGPLYGREVAEVVVAVGGRPVLAFTNDATAAASGAFALGVTPSQTVSATLRYARERGVRRAVLVAGPEPWGRQAAAAASATGAAVGLEVVEVTLEAATGAGSGLAELLARASGGAPPDAVLLADARTALLGPARQLREAGVQLLATSQWTDAGVEALGALEGAWLAAPDPARFTDFAAAYRRRWQAPPGALAALAFDAATIAREVAAAGDGIRAALLRPSGFSAVTGPLRLEAGGRCVRELAILTVARGVLTTVDRMAAA